MNKAIAFDEKEHKYLRSDTEYVSVTTLIKKYELPFNSWYWSRYKAIKDILGKYGQFNNFKWQVGGWENVVDYYETMGNPPHKAEVEERIRYYLNLWEEKGQEAREKGTAVHKKLEDEINNSIYQKHEDGTVLIPMPNAPTHDPIAVEKNAILSEVIVFNDHFQIAGMVDKIKKRDKILDISDHKTSKEITKVAFRDEVMKHPVSHLPNANYYIYSLQMSLYGWMLEQFGYVINSLTIEHRDRENGELIELYPVSYLKKEIELILTHYGSTK